MINTGNLVNSSEIYGSTVSDSLSNGQNLNLQAPSSANAYYILKSAILTNTNANLDVQVRCSLTHYNPAPPGELQTAYLLKDAWVPAGTSLIVINESNMVYLFQRLQMITSVLTGNDLDVVYKYDYIICT